MIPGPAVETRIWLYYGKRNTAVASDPGLAEERAAATGGCDQDADEEKHRSEDEQDLLLRLDELVSQLDSLAKKAAAFFRISFSS